MITKHTPSVTEWEARDVGHGIHIGDIAWIGFGSTYPKETHKANARLIAASPDLLQFAEWAMGQFCGESGTGEIHWEQFPEFVAGQRAIAKATGKEVA